MRKSNIIKIGSVVVIVAVGFLGMNLLSSTQKKSNKRKLNPEIRTVETKTIHFSNYTLEVNGSGVIESKRKLKIISETSGKIIYAKNDLKDGTFAKSGEVLLKIDPREVENYLYSLRADFMNSVASVLPEMKIEQHNEYNKWLQYFNSLDIHKDISELPEVHDSKTKMKISTRSIYSNYYKVKNQEILLSKHTITAPFDGFINTAGVIKNSFVSKGQLLFTFNDVINLEIAVPLLVDDFDIINVSGSAGVQIYSEKNKNEFIIGRVSRTDTRIDRNSQTLNAYVSFSNKTLNPYFLPGNYVKIKLRGQKLKSAAAIPRHVVDNDNFIYTMDEGKLKKLKVDIISMENDVAVIKNTIPEGTELVTTILQKPIIGMNIQSLNRVHQTDEIKTDNSSVAISD